MTAPGAPAATPAAHSRALLVMAAAGALVLVAFVADLLAWPATPGTPDPVPQGTADSGAWYCPVTAGEDEPAVLAVAAVGDEPSTVTVVRYPEQRSEADEPVTIQPGEEHTVRLEGAASRTPLSVRWEGGPAVATWRIATGDEAAAPCEPGPAEKWYLAGLDTAGGARSVVHLFNAFAVDAVARVTYATPEGHVRLVRTEHVFVGARSSVQLDLGTYQPEQPDLGATIEVLTGRLVAQGELVLDPPGEEGGPTGRALVPASSQAVEEWSFGYARIDESSSSWLSVVNPGQREAAVEVRVSSPTPEAGVQEHSVPAGGILRIDLAELSEEPEFGVSATSVNDVPIIAHRVVSLAQGDRPGVAVSRGGQATNEWALVGAGAGDRRGRVNVYNPGAEPVRIDVITSGEDPPEWRGAEIPANGWFTLSLADAYPDRPTIPVVVRASGPVVAELRSHHESGALRLWSSVGVPAAAWTGSPTRPAVRRDPSLSTRPLDEGAPGLPTPPPTDPGDIPEVPDPDADADADPGGESDAGEEAEPGAEPPPG